MDTVIIKLNGFKVANISLFLPELNKRRFQDLSPTERQSTRTYLRAFRFEPPHQDAYLPKIEVYEALNDDRNELTYTLQARFSVPKLLYGNSVQEVNDNDLERVIYAFTKALTGAGIVVSSTTVANARVSQVDFCKNIILPRDIRMQEVLTELQRTDISKAIDMTQKEYKHGGRTLHIYSQTVERVFYDKVNDATRPKGKRKDKGHIEREREVIDRYGLANREIFRYEYRLKKNQAVKQKVNAALRRPYPTVVQLKDLFTPNLCKTILLQSWRDLIQRPENQLALLGPKDDLALLQHIMGGAREQGAVHSMNRAFTSYGLTRAIRDHGAKEVRKAAAGWNANHGERLTKKMRVAAALTEGLPYSNSIAVVSASLEQFEYISLSTLENVV